MSLTRRALLAAASTGVACAFGSAETLPKSSLIEPADLAAQLKTRKPMVICVAFPVLYRSAHIEGAVYGGAGSKPEGLETLAALVKDTPKDRDIVLYCGCCPWDHCPNIAPAFQKLSSLGFKKVKAMIVAQNLRTDWIDKGYPTFRAAAA